MKKPIRILFGGDVTSTGRTAEKLNTKERVDLWGNTRALVSSHDYAICNLESPLLDEGQPIKKVGPNLKGHAELAAFIKEWGFHAVSLANNHIMDFGDYGLSSTLQTCHSAGLETFGAGATLEAAESAHRVTIQDRQISFIAAAEEEFCIAKEGRGGAAPLLPIPLHRRVECERKQSHWVIVIIHGGNEHYFLPRPGLQEMSRFLIRTGADAVIGHHPHISGGYEIYQGNPIYYSIGNLLFDRPDPVPTRGWNSGYFLSLSLEDGISPKAEIHPYTQAEPENLGVYLCDEMRTIEAKEATEKLRSIIEDATILEKEWLSFCTRGAPTLPYLCFYKNKHIIRMVKMLNKTNILPTRYWATQVLNRIRCESHREHFITWAENYAEGKNQDP